MKTSSPRSRQLGKFRQSSPARPTVLMKWGVMFACSVGLILHAPTAPAAETDWNFPRGNLAASGASPYSLPDEIDVAWEFRADEAIEAAPIISGDRVFAADVFGTLYAVSRKDGSPVWKKEYDTGFLASPIVSGDRLVIGDVEGNIYVLSVEDGSEIWKASADGEISGSAAVYKDRVLVASQDGKLYCFKMENGEPVWVYQANDQIRCAPTVAGNLTFLGGCDAQLHIVDLTTGKAVGDTLPIDGPTGSTPAVIDDKAILPIMDGSVFAFDWKKKQQLWRYEDLEQTQEYRSSAAVADGIAVVSSQRRQIDAIDVNTGKQKWRHTLKRRADASPVIAGKDIWIAATDGRLVRLDLATGKEKWVHEVRGSYIASVAVTDREIIAADDDGIIRCFRAKK